MNVKSHIINLVAYGEESFNAFFTKHLSEIENVDEFKELSIDFCEMLPVENRKQLFVLFFHLYITKSLSLLERSKKLYELQFSEEHIAKWFDVEDVQNQLEMHLKDRQSIFSILSDEEVVHEQLSSSKNSETTDTFNVDDAEDVNLDDVLAGFGS